MEFTIGFEHAQILESPEEKRQALRAIMSHYSEQKFFFTKESLASVCSICIRIEEMTGKKSGY